MGRQTHCRRAWSAAIAWVAASAFRTRRRRPWTCPAAGRGSCASAVWRVESAARKSSSGEGSEGGASREVRPAALAGGRPAGGEANARPASAERSDRGGAGWATATACEGRCRCRRKGGGRRCRHFRDGRRQRVLGGGDRLPPPTVSVDGEAEAAATTTNVEAAPRAAAAAAMAAATVTSTVTVVVSTAVATAAAVAVTAVSTGLDGGVGGGEGRPRSQRRAGRPRARGLRATVSSGLWQKPHGCPANETAGRPCDRRRTPWSALLLTGP